MQLISINKKNINKLKQTFFKSKKRPFGDKKIVDFLNEISKEILKNKLNRAYPDIITFGFFCRKTAIERSLRDRKSFYNRFGWGLIVHVTPSNIPINFAFSLVFGLLSGNHNIIRLPSENWPQIQFLVSIFEKVSKKKKFKDLRKTNLFIQTDRDDLFLKELISYSDGLVVWGGDDTIKNFRNFEKKPRCCELYFPNRNSSLVVNSKIFKDISKNELQKIALKFFNDTYLVDNNACSSPRQIYWIGNNDEISKIKKEFWKSIDKVLEIKEYNLNIVAKIDKFLDILKSVRANNSDIKVNKLSENIWTTRKKEDLVVGRYGRFVENNYNNLETALKNITDDEQTLTYLGFSSQEIKKILFSIKIKVDRVIPMGRALEIDFIWDGVDILNRLSRVVDIR
jgi:hypothetical protein